jgi:hypothetical protein
MRTCLENCRVGDMIYWRVIKEEMVFVVRDPMDTGVVATTALTDGRVVHFYPRDLVPNKNGYVITKIRKYKNEVLPS